jgi:hypothetical protein
MFEGLRNFFGAEKDEEVEKDARERSTEARIAEDMAKREKEEAERGQTHEAIPGETLES